MVNTPIIDWSNCMINFKSTRSNDSRVWNGTLLNHISGNNINLYIWLSHAYILGWCSNWRHWRRIEYQLILVYLHHWSWNSMLYCRTLDNFWSFLCSNVHIRLFVHHNWSWNMLHNWHLYWHLYLMNNWSLMNHWSLTNHSRLSYSMHNWSTVNNWSSMNHL